MSSADLETRGAELQRAMQAAQAELRTALMAGRTTNDARAKITAAAGAIEAHQAEVTELTRVGEAERYERHRAASTDIVEGAMQRLRQLLDDVVMPPPPPSLSNPGSCS